MGKCYMRRTNLNPTMSLSLRRLSSVLSVGLLLSLPMISEKVIPCATRYVFGIHPRLHVSAWRSFPCLIKQGSENVRAYGGDKPV